MPKQCIAICSDSTGEVTITCDQTICDNRKKAVFYGSAVLNGKVYSVIVEYSRLDPQPTIDPALIE